jgi:hypothetical protein
LFPHSTNKQSDTADQSAPAADPNATGDYADAGRSTATGPSGPPADFSDALIAAFGDRYDLESRLGQGGFGTVVKALDRRLNRRVAIKVSQSHAASPEQLLREARSLAQLRHPGIVSVYDVAVVGPFCFVVSELLAGPNLADWLTTRLPPPGDAVRIAAQVADALAHAHARSIIHRDVKPSNIVFADEGRPVLVDFGLALSDLDAGTGRGVVSGTPAYMSPEQVEGRAHRPDGRTDVYSLAASLYTLLCGRQPFRGRTHAEVMAQVLEDEPQPLRQMRAEVPAGVERVCLKGMAKRPADRYTTAADFAEALRQAVGLVPAPASAPVLPSAPSRPTAARAARTERRRVTLLHCSCEPPDDAEDDPTEQLAAFQGSCSEVVKTHGGLVLQATGTAFLACFGYPVAREDAPRQAVRAALEIGQRCGPVAVLAAVDSGPAVVTEVPNATPVVVGDVMNAVTALAAQVREHGVVVAEAAYRLVEGYFDCEPAGEVQPRGTAAAVPVYRARGERAAHTRVDAADPARLSPLIGRDREVALLRERWDLAAEGVRNVILIVADPGLGKSRLIRVLRDQVRQAPGVDVVEWYCSAYHQGSPFFPVIEYFDRAYQLARAPDPRRRLDLLLARLEDDGVRDPEQQALLAAMLSVPAESRLPDLALSPERQKEKTRDALLVWLSARTDQATVFFVVEDLHWIDPSTESLLARFVEQGGEARVLALFTFRPEYDPPWKSQAVQTQVALNRLTRGQITEMVRAQTGDAATPQSVIDQIAERTDGVPLFVEEFTRLVMESGPGPGGVAAAIPASLHDLLLARLDRMASVREVVQLGAVIGRTFAYDVIRAASGLDDTAFRTELDKLVGAGLLFAKGAPPRCTYTFKHALIQDAAYQSMVKKTRQQFHGQVAAALERSFPDVVETQPEVLAHHLAEAGEAARSIEFWLAAGRRAQRRSAHVEAIGHLRHGLALVPKLPEPARPTAELGLQVTLGVSLMATQGYASEQVAASLARSMELCDAVGPAAPRFPVLWGNWAWRMIRDDLREAARLAGEIIALAERTGDRAVAAEGHLAATCTATWSGNWKWQAPSFASGWAAFDLPASLEMMRFTGQNVGVMLAQFRPYTFWAAGLPDQMRAAIAEGEQLAATVGHPFSASCFHWHSAVVLGLTRDLPAARRHAETGLAIANDRGYPFWVGMNTMAVGMVMQLEGATGAAERLATGIRTLRATGAEATVTVFQAYLADALRELGRRDEARAVVEEGLAGVAARGGRIGEVDLILARARLLDGAEAIAEVRRAVEVAREQGAVWLELRAALALAPVDPAPLAAIYARLAEGLDLPEPAAARAVLRLAI